MGYQEKINQATKKHLESRKDEPQEWKWGYAEGMHKGLQSRIWRAHPEAKDLIKTCEDYEHIIRHIQRSEFNQALSHVNRLNQTNKEE